MSSVEDRAKMESQLAEKAAVGLEVAGEIADAFKDSLEVLEIACPPISPIFKICAAIVSQAALAIKNKLAFALLKERIDNLIRPLQEIQKSRNLQAKCGGAVQKVQSVLMEAQRLLERHSSEGWLKKWWHANSFKESFLGIDSELIWCITTLNFEVAAEHERRIRKVGKTSAEKDREHDAEILRLKKQVEELMSSDSIEQSGGTDIRTLLQEARASRSGSIVDEPANLVVSAARAGNFVEVDRLIHEQGADVNASGRSYFLLHQAIFWESAYGVMMLLNHGADPNCVTKLFDRKLELAAGSTPLHLAVAYANEEIVRLLLLAGADPERADSEGKKPANIETTPSCTEALTQDLAQAVKELRKALFRSTVDWEVIQSYIVEHKLPIDARLGQDFSLIHYAAYQKDWQAYKMLVNYRAHPLLRSRLEKKLCSEIDGKETADGQKFHEFARGFELKALAAAPLGYKELQWKVRDGEWRSYPISVQLKVADADAQKQPKIFYELDDGTRIELDLVRMLQINNKSGKERPLRRAA